MEREEIKITNITSNFVSPITQQKFKTVNAFSKHLKKNGLSIELWFVDNYLNGEWPLCSCGCGEKVIYRYGKFLKYATLECAASVNCRNESLNKKRSESLRKTFADPKYKEIFKNRNDKRFLKKENRLAISNAMKIHWDGDESICHKEAIVKFNKREDIRKKRSSTMKKKWENDKEYRDKVIKGTKEYILNNPEAAIDRLRKSQVKGGRSKVEKVLEEEMSKLSIEFETQKVVQGNFDGRKITRIFDFYFPQKNLYLEIDGDFHHGQDRQDGFTSYQLVNIANDHLKDFLIKAIGANIVRIKSSNIVKKKSIGIFIERLRNGECLETLFEDYACFAVDVLGKIEARLSPKENIEDQLVSDRVEVFQGIMNCLKQNYVEDLKAQLVVNKTFSVNEIILPRTYFLDLRQKLGSDKYRELGEEFSEIILDYMYEIFPLYPKTSQNVKEIRKDIEKIQQGERVLRDNIKPFFPSYFDASRKNKKTPCELYLDREFMKKVVLYRIGCNGSKQYKYKLSNGNDIGTNETFHLSVKNILNGIRAKLGTVSFFSASLAMSLYEKYAPQISDEEIVIYDPSFGYGGRYMGSFCLPKTHYIGTDPNGNVYREIIALREVIESEFHTACFYNMPSEDLILPEKSVDFVFSSPPYWDKEIFSDDSYQSIKRFSDYENWLQGFVRKTSQNILYCLKQNGKGIIVMASDLVNDFEQIYAEVGFRVKIIDLNGNISHFDRKHNKVPVRQKILYFEK